MQWKVLAETTWAEVVAMGHTVCPRSWDVMLAAVCTVLASGLLAEVHMVPVTVVLSMVHITLAGNMAQCTEP